MYLLNIEVNVYTHYQHVYVTMYFICLFRETASFLVQIRRLNHQYVYFKNDALLVFSPRFAVDTFPGRQERATGSRAALTNELCCCSACPTTRNASAPFVRKYVLSFFHSEMKVNTMVTVPCGASCHAGVSCVSLGSAGKNLLCQHMDISTFALIPAAQKDVKLPAYQQDTLLNTKCCLSNHEDFRRKPADKIKVIAGR